MTLLSHSMTLFILSLHKNFATSANLILVTLLWHSHWDWPNMHVFSNPASKQSSTILFSLALWFANQTPVHHQLQSTLGGCGFEARGWAVPFIMWLLYSLVWPEVASNKAVKPEIWMGLFQFIFCELWLPIPDGKTRRNKLEANCSKTLNLGTSLFYQFFSGYLEQSWEARWMHLGC